MKRRNIIVAVVIVVLILGYWVYSRSTSSPQSSGEGSEQTYIVKRAVLKETLTISGEFDAQEKVTLTFPTGGKLAWVGVKEGDVVEQYQGIASLDQRDLEKRLQSSLNTFMISRWDLDQTKSDNKDAVYTDGELGEQMRRIIDKAQFGLNNAVIGVELQALAKEYAYLSTPIAGVVTRVGAPYAGVTVTATTAFDVVNPATVYFSATADQTEVTRLHTGLTSTILVDAYPEEPVKATVSEIAFTPRVGDTGTSYEVKLNLLAPIRAMKYRIGMTGDVEFLLREKRNVYAVPVPYVTTSGGKKYVTILSDGKKVRREVQVGEEGDTEIEIVKGVNTGDVLVDIVN